MEKPAGYVSNSSDCNDYDAAIRPGVPELADGKDNDCNGSVDDGLACRKLWNLAIDNDGYGDNYVTLTKYSCIKPNSYVDNATDCKPNDANHKRAAGKDGCKQGGCGLLCFIGKAAGHGNE